MALSFNIIISDNPSLVQSTDVITFNFALTSSFDVAVIVDHEQRIDALEAHDANDLVLGETSTTAYRGDRGKTAFDHSQTTGNPHSTAIGDISGLTSALGDKVDKVTGKGLSTEDYTTAEQSKLSGIAAGAEVNINADWNAVSGDAEILNKPTIPSIVGLESQSNKDASNGYVGLTLFAHNFWNSAKTFLTTVIGTATQTRTISLPNNDGTIALTSDIPDVSGKEDTSNKVTSISGSSTDVQYPSAKLLYDQLALKESPLTFGSGVTRTVNAVANDLITGKSGGQTIIFGTEASEKGTLQSTVNGTRGGIEVGTNTIGENLSVLATLGTEDAPVLTTGNYTLGTGWSYGTSPDRIEKLIDGTGTITPTAATTLVVGSTYKLVLDVTISANSFSFTFGSISGGTISATGVYTYYITAGTTSKLIITPSATALRCVINSISYKLVTVGNLTVDGNLKIRKPLLNEQNINCIHLLSNGQVLINSLASLGSGAKLVVSGGIYTDSFIISAAAIQGLQLQTSASATELSISINGENAHSIEMARRSTANTAGNNLTIKSGGATSGATDKGSGNIILANGISTGTGKGAIKIQRLSRAATTSTSDNTLSSAMEIHSEFNLVDASANSLFEIALSTLAMAGGTINFTIEATDGTDTQVYAGIVTFAAVNKVGVYTTSIVENISTNVASAGTITNVWSILEGTNKITIQTTPNSSLTTTLFKIKYIITNCNGAIITQL